MTREGVKGPKQDQEDQEKKEYKEETRDKEHSRDRDKNSNRKEGKDDNNKQATKNVRGCNKPVITKSKTQHGGGFNRFVRQAGTRASDGSKGTGYDNFVKQTEAKADDESEGTNYTKNENVGGDYGHDGTKADIKKEGIGDEAQQAENNSQSTLQDPGVNI